MYSCELLYCWIVSKRKVTPWVTEWVGDCTEWRKDYPDYKFKYFLLSIDVLEPDEELLPLEDVILKKKPGRLLAFGRFFFLNIFKN